MNKNSLKSFLKSDSITTPSGRIVRVLSERGSLSAAQISRLTGLARSTVSTAVADLRRSGLISEAGIHDLPGSKAVGRPGTALTLNPDAGTVVGIHLALDELRVAIADVSHSVISEQNIALPRDYGPDMAALALKDWVRRTYAENGLNPAGLLGLGISVSAPVSPDGTVHRASIVPTWAGVNVVKVFGKVLSTTVRVDNESNCSAIAELMWGAAQGQDNFVIFKMDLGVGGAIVIDGKVVTGIAGSAGEFGHICIDPEGDLCRCGNRGCLELKASFQTPLRELERTRGHPVSVDDAIRLALAGDVGAARMITDAAEVAGRGLAMIGTVINPPLILIGGALAQAGALVLEPLRASYEKYTLLKSRDLPPESRTRIDFGGLLKNDVVLGAIGLVLRHHGRAG